MRAPPVMQVTTTGSPFSVAYSKPRVIRSPSAQPSEPPRKPKLCRIQTTSRPEESASRAHVTPASSPVLAVAAASWSE
jgi:hypothetical protein